MNHPLSHALGHIKGRMRYAKKPGWKPGFIYLIQCHDFVKVGYADNIPVRLSQLQTGCPYELHLLASFKVDKMNISESRLHDLWQRYEVMGEWFQVPAGELAAAANAATFEDIFKN